MSPAEILWITSLVLGLINALCYAYQIVYLFLPLLKKTPRLPAEKPLRYAILIAARNEEAVIPHLLQSIRAQDYPAQLFTTYVIADNCTDCTAQVAAERGARVFTRFDPTRVGKGYALHDLLEKIAAADGLENYDAFLVFDADNLLRPDFIRQINRVASNGYDVFCSYRNSKNFGANWISAGHGVWYLHESVHLNQSRMLLGNPCMVNGTGFGFTRQLLEKCGGWHFFTLTEDMEFSMWCITHGIRAGYCGDAVLYDEQPQTFRQSWRQRTRWIQGGVQVSIRCAGKLFRGILRFRRTSLHCLEAATLSLWGYGASALCTAVSLLAAYVSSGIAGLGQALLWFLGSAYLTTLGVGAITLATEKDRIRATGRQKIMGLFAFPLHMLTYIPIAASALFRKYHWPPIEHTAAISVTELCANKKASP